MITLITSKTPDFHIQSETYRIQLFLGYKNLEYRLSALSTQEIEEMKKNFNFSSFPLFVNTENTITEKSISIIREIETSYPHPIGFIGPVEGLVQSVNMLIPKNMNIPNPTSHSFLETIFQDILNMIDDSDFLMGPTFTVADCILGGDILALSRISSLHIPKKITEYAQRVQRKCRVTNI